MYTLSHTSLQIRAREVNRTIEKHVKVDEHEALCE